MPRPRARYPLPALVALLPAALAAQAPRAPAPRPAPAAIAAAVDSLATRAVAAGITPALGVAIAMDGRTIYRRAFGWADATARIPADTSTLWYVASTSKSYTGFGVALLAQQGALRLDDPIAKLLPGTRWHARAGADSLTLAQFLSHTHHLDDNAIVMSAAYTGEIPEARWPSLLALAEPSGNSDLVYSNFGYNVAAMVIDRLRPEGWRRFLEDAVYAPAGMTQTFTHLSGIAPARIARPHRLQPDGGYATEPFFKTDATMNSAGGHVATLGDLARWTIVQMDGGVIDGRRAFPAEAVALGQRMIAPQTRAQARRFAYFDRDGWAAGWDVGSYEGEPMIGRFGSYHSTRSHLSFLPRRRIGVVAVSTGGLGSSLTDLIAAFAYDLEAGKPEARARAGERLDQLITRLAGSRLVVAAQDSVREVRSRLPLERAAADYVGAYGSAPYGRVEITARDGRLRYRWGALSGDLVRDPAAPGRFSIEIAGSADRIDFEFPATGEARALTVSGVRFLRSR